MDDPPSILKHTQKLILEAHSTWKNGCFMATIVPHHTGLHCLMVHSNRQYPKALPGNILGHLMGQSLTGKVFTLLIHSIRVCLLPQEFVNKMIISLQELNKTKAQSLKSAPDQQQQSCYSFI